MHSHITHAKSTSPDSCKPSDTDNHSLLTHDGGPCLPLSLSYYALGAATACSLLLCLYHGGVRLWYDEYASLAMATLPRSEFFQILAAREANMMLYYVLLRIWTIFGDGSLFVRLPTIIFAVLSVPLIFLVGRKLFGASTGLVASVFLAVNTYHVRYAQEARAYSLAVFLVLLSTYVLIRLIERPSWGAASAYAVSISLAIFSHIFCVLVLISHLAVLLPRARHAAGRRHALPVVALVAAITLPYWILVVRNSSVPITWIPPMSWGMFQGFLVQLSGNAGLRAVQFYGVLIILAVFVAAPGARAAGKANEGWQDSLVLGWFALPILITVLFSVCLRPVFWPRYLIICLPAMLLLAARGALLLHYRTAVPATALALWFAYVGLGSYYRADFDVVREDYPALVSAMAAESQPGDCSAFYTAKAVFGFKYLIADSRISGMPRIQYPNTSENPFLTTTTPSGSRFKDCRRVWLTARAFTETRQEPALRDLKAAISEQHRELRQRAFTGLILRLYTSAPSQEAVHNIHAVSDR